MLGRLQQIPNIRTTWANEASDFTPWLSRPENLSTLSEALGMGPDGLEFESSEEGVGPFRADIICRDTGTAEGARVLIENQFGQSDHDHLGKLLTYASGLNARTVILIGERIRDEHRAALDWLNIITSDDHNFFACELELWRIGDSLPAPKFNVVVQPNDWSREVRRGLSSETGTPSELKLTYLRFWETFNEVLEDSDCPLRPRKPAAKNWMDYSLGKTGIVLRLEISEQQRRSKIGVYLQSEASEAWFSALEADRAVIEAELGPLIWDPLPGRKSSWIGLLLENADPTDEADWPRQHEWLVDMIGRFHAAFRPFVMNLRTDHQSPETIEAIE